MEQLAAVYKSYEKLNEAVEALKSQGISEDRIQVSHSQEEPPFPTGSPLSSLRLSEDIVQTMPASGGNLVGNSVSVDVELSQLPEILESVANAQPEQVETSYLLTVELVDDNPELRETSEKILQETEGELVEVSHSDL